MGYPAGLHIIEQLGTDPEAPAVVFVHGSLDRADSFRRVMRRLPEFRLVAYDETTLALYRALLQQGA